MTLRTPRRRISPRTKLRYRAIREFFRRALGSTSQQEIKINSSIAVNVTDLKRKIVGLEQQLDEVNRHCRDFAGLEDCSRKESENSFQYDFRHEIETIKEQSEESSDIKSNGLETQHLYKSSDGTYKKSENSHYLSKPDFDNKLIGTETPIIDYNEQVAKVNHKKNKAHHTSQTSAKLHKHKAKPVYENILLTTRSTSSFHSLANTNMNDVTAEHPNYIYDKKPFKKENFKETIPQNTKDRKYKEFVKKNTGDNLKVTYEDKPIRHRKNKSCTRNLDPDFIADIIRKQYKPVKMFGRKESDFSQFSAPVCRDQEFSLKDNILEGSELCSCFHPETGRRYKRQKHHDLVGMRSVCDTRLYSTNKHMRQKHRRMHIDTCSNSDMYDFIPVKERSSPKTRRKFVDANMVPYDSYKEVPPSPRSLRPRLNLKAQYYTELEDYMAQAKQKFRRRLSQRQKLYPQCERHYESDNASEFVPEKIMTQPQNSQKYGDVPIEEEKLQNEIHQDDDLLNHSQYINEQTSTAVDTSLKEEQEAELNVDKTDKALCEIKDILQSFLHEIKKEAVPSPCNKSDTTCKTTQDMDSNILPDPNTNINNNVIPNSASLNSYNQCMPQSYMPPFPTNTCCYPVMPVCPINCPLPMQTGGYLMPSQSYTCSNCVNVPKESASSQCVNINTEPACSTETDELIKEIYKFVAQGPVGKQNQDNNYDSKYDESKALTSRSVGASNQNYQHDAKVGTQPLKCYSKSCEAIGSRMVSDTYYSGTNASYSDTLIEKLSLEGGTSETELDTDVTMPEKRKGNKFSRVLRSFGLFKKKKKDVIEELSESESVTEEDLKPETPVFRQNVQNYMMHGQEYYHPPPLKPVYERQQEYQRHPDDYQRHPDDYQSEIHDYHHPVRDDYEARAQEYQHPPREYPSRSHEFQHRPNKYHPDYDRQPYDPRMRGYSSPRYNEPYAEMHPQQHSRPRDYRDARSPSPRKRPTAPYSSSYDTSYSQMQPPLCLKEIEVKSTGTQSERKMSIFKKLKKKTQPPVIVTHMAAAGDQRTFSTQTANDPTPKIIKPFFTWKSLQAKAMAAMPSPDLDPMAYSYKTQKELATGDVKMRNVMLKKMFHKRNPFSPRNLILRTLMGKDRSSFGEYPQMLKPRMIF